MQGIDLDNWDDPNFDPTATILQDESPYVEVRCAVTNTDDPMMPSSTFRSWVIGIICAALIPGFNQLFYLRYPTIQILGVCLRCPLKPCSSGSSDSFMQWVPLLLTYPIGKAWARYLPKVSLFGMSLNPGPFTIKEHVIITIMASVNDVPAYAVSDGFGNIS